MNITEVELWLDKKKTYDVGFEQSKKNCFMSVDKSYLAIILELFSPEEMFETFDKKYSVINSAYLHQLLRNC